MLQYLPMTSVALLLGGECTGKTALAHALAHQITSRPVAVVDEALREFTARTGRPPTQREQEGIWSEQTQLFQEALAKGPDGGLVICDPAPLMTAVYSLQYFNDDSLVSRALEATDKAGVVVLMCAPDIPWEPDGIQRDGPLARQSTHEILESVIVPQLRETQVICVGGPLDERIAQVMPYVE